MSDDTTNENPSENQNDAPDSGATMVMESPLHNAEASEPGEGAANEEAGAIDQAESTEQAEAAGEEDAADEATQVMQSPLDQLSDEQRAALEQATEQAKAATAEQAEAAPAEPAEASEPQAAAEPEQPKKKRRKIDLKARLSNVRAAGGAPASSRTGESDPLTFPPPPSGSVPPPKILSSVSGSVAQIVSPFAPAAPEPKPTMQQQTIKVEMGEEILQERKKAKRKSAIVGFFCIVLGLGLGFGVGAAKEQGARGKRAQAGAEKLRKEIEASNKKMLDLADALRSGAETMQDGEYPEALADKLKGLNVPFSPENFKGKGVGGLPWEVQRTLFSYTSGIEKLNKRKDSLRNLLSGQKKTLVTIFARMKKPVVGYAVSLKKDRGNVVAQLLPIKEPFEDKAKWPAKFTVVRPAGKKTQDVEAEMYTKGNPVSGNVNKPLAIPVDRKTTQAFSSRAAVNQMAKSFRDMRNLVNGNQSPIPQLQTQGLVKEGKRLIEALNKIGNN